MSYEVNFLFSKPFMKKWFKCGLSLDEREELKNEILQYLSNSPINTYGKKFPGVIVEGTGGAFKYRFTPKNYHKGKSGSFRTIYAMRTNSQEKEQRIPLHLLMRG